MEDKKTMEELAEGCTHNCATCHSGCGEQSGGAGKIEKALLAVSEMDEQELLDALKDF